MAKQKRSLLLLFVFLIIGLSLTPLIASMATTATYQTSSESFSTNTASNSTWNIIQCVYNQSLHPSGLTLVPPYPNTGGPGTPRAFAFTFMANWTWPLYRLEFWASVLSGTYFNVTSDVRTGIIAETDLGTIIENSTTFYNSTCMEDWFNFTFSPVTLTFGDVYGFVIRDAAQGGTGTWVIGNTVSSGGWIQAAYSYWSTYSNAPALRIYANQSLVNSTVVLAHNPAVIDQVTVNGTITTNYSNPGTSFLYIHDRRSVEVNNIDCTYGSSTINIVYSYVAVGAATELMLSLFSVVWVVFIVAIFTVIIHVQRKK